MALLSCLFVCGNVLKNLSRIRISCIDNKEQDDRITDVTSKQHNEQRNAKMKTNEIAIARKAIKTAISNGTIAKEISGMHRIGIEAIIGMCKNELIASELAWEAAKDVKLG